MTNKLKKWLEEEVALATGEVEAAKGTTHGEYWYGYRDAMQAVLGKALTDDQFSEDHLRALLDKLISADRLACDAFRLLSLRNVGAMNEAVDLRNEVVEEIIEYIRDLPHIEPQDPNLAQAIKDIEEDISTHEIWRDKLLAKDPKYTQPVTVTPDEIGGDVSHHEKWIERLTNVLNCLKRIAAGEQAIDPDDIGTEKRSAARMSGDSPVATCWGCREEFDSDEAVHEPFAYCDCDVHEAGEPHPDPYMLDPNLLMAEEFYCDCVRYSYWMRCEGHRDLDHDEEPPVQVPYRPEPTEWRGEEFSQGEWRFRQYFRDEGEAESWQAWHPEVRRLIPLSPFRRGPEGV